MLMHEKHFYIDKLLICDVITLKRITHCVNHNKEMITVEDLLRDLNKKHD